MGIRLDYFRRLVPTTALPTSTLRAAPRRHTVSARDAGGSQLGQLTRCARERRASKAASAQRLGHGSQLDRGPLCCGWNRQKGRNRPVRRQTSGAAKRSPMRPPFRRAQMPLALPTKPPGPSPRLPRADCACGASSAYKFRQESRRTGPPSLIYVRPCSDAGRQQTMLEPGPLAQMCLAPVRRSCR